MTPASSGISTNFPTSIDGLAVCGPCFRALMPLHYRLIFRLHF
jgi:hypothetical protein